MGRDNPKDVFDILLISQSYGIIWSEILRSAKEKLLFNTEDLIYRLKSFPVSLLGKINLLDKDFLNDFEQKIEKVIEDIQDA